ncbi:MAG: Hpt domain-containing protein [Alphaproteobacteria bacterium]
MLNEQESLGSDTFAYEEVIAALRGEFRVDAQDRLAQLDSDLVRVRKKTVTGASALSELCREIHTLKGNGGSFGYPTISVIAHRLESYITGISGLDDTSIDDIMVFLDRMRDVLDDDDDDEKTAEIVRALPVHTINRMPDTEGVDLEVLLTASTPIIGRAVEGEFKLQGCRVTMLNNPIDAFAMAIRMRPDVVVASAISKDISGADMAAAFRSMQATQNIVFALLTSFPRTHPELKDLPTEILLIRHDRDLPGEITRLRERIDENSAA